MADLRKPVGERHAPWAYPFQNWVTPPMVRDLGTQLAPALQGGGDESITPATRSYLERHPAIARLVPLWLDRGDPQAREMGLLLAQFAKTPEQLEALRDFALGQRGPDRMRHKAATIASEAGLIPSGDVRMWLQGEWREVMLFGFELDDEPISELAPGIEPLLEQALEALRQGTGAEAEPLLRQALEIDPDEPSVLNNLAIAYEQQGRKEEADAVVRQVFEQHPENVVSRSAMSRLLVQQGELDQAETLLRPLFEQKRFHPAAFGAFCNVQIELYLARGRRESALSWLGMWADVDPDQPAVRYWQRRLNRPTWSRGPFGR
jgi:tetratricopeptide (TPR) repeat protein